MHVEIAVTVWYSTCLLPQQAARTYHDILIFKRTTFRPAIMRLDHMVTCQPGQGTSRITPSHRAGVLLAHREVAVRGRQVNYVGVRQGGHTDQHGVTGTLSRDKRRTLSPKCSGKPKSSVVKTRTTVFRRSRRRWRSPGDLRAILPRSRSGYPEPHVSVVTVVMIPFQLTEFLLDYVIELCKQAIRPSWEVFSFWSFFVAVVVVPGWRQGDTLLRPKNWNGWRWLPIILPLVEYFANFFLENKCYNNQYHIHNECIFIKNINMAWAENSSSHGIKP